MTLVNLAIVVPILFVAFVTVIMIGLIRRDWNREKEESRRKKDE